MYRYILFAGEIEPRLQGEPPSPRALVFKCVLYDYCACCGGHQSTTTTQARAALPSLWAFVSRSSFLLVVWASSDSHCFSHPHRMTGPTAGYSVSRSSLPPAPSPRVAGSPFLCFFVPSRLLKADVISSVQALRHRLCVSAIHLVFMLPGCSIAFGDEGAEPRATSPCLFLCVSVLFICRV